MTLADQKRLEMYQTATENLLIIMRSVAEAEDASGHLRMCARKAVEAVEQYLQTAGNAIDTLETTLENSKCQ